MAMVTAARLGRSPQQQAELACELAEQLLASGSAGDAAVLLLQHAGDAEGAVAALAAGREWREALRVGYATGRADLVDTDVVPSAAQARVRARGRVRVFVWGRGGGVARVCLRVTLRCAAVSGLTCGGSKGSTCPPRRRPAHGTPHSAARKQRTHQCAQAAAGLLSEASEALARIDKYRSRLVGVRQRRLALAAALAAAADGGGDGGGAAGAAAAPGDDDDDFRSEASMVSGFSVYTDATGTAGGASSGSSASSSRAPSTLGGRKAQKKQAHAARKAAKKAGRGGKIRAGSPGEGGCVCVCVCVCVAAACVFGWLRGRGLAAPCVRPSVSGGLCRSAPVCVVNCSVAPAVTCSRTRMHA
jgi:elongator complex protein 1